MTIDDIRPVIRDVCSSLQRSPNRCLSVRYEPVNHRILPRRPGGSFSVSTIRGRAGGSTGPLRLARPWVGPVTYVIENAGNRGPLFQ
ncbi:hypothetical protein DP49_4976 [Burkholderia pseudomallei]|nr:hypothetical protein DP49_4976 [Burkholderia pseudomallei]